MNIDQMKPVVLDQQVDPLKDFALTCRLELRTVYARANVAEERRCIDWSDLLIC